MYTCDGYKLLGIKLPEASDLIGQLVKCIRNQEKGCTECFTCMKAELLQTELYRCNADCECNYDTMIYLSYL